MKPVIPILLVAGLLYSCTGKRTERGDSVTGQSGDMYGIAFNVLVDEANDNYDIFTMNLDGTEQRNITNNPDVAWTYLSHDSTVFFLSDRDTVSRSYFLYEMDYSGEHVRKIADIRLSDSWMGVRKDGKELIVTPHPSVDSVLYVIDRQGNILQKIWAGTLYASNPEFSPDGQRIAFVGKNKPSKREPGYREEIYTMNADGSGLKQLTHYPPGDTTAEWWAYMAGPPRWHPTDGYITYHSKQGGKYSLYAVSEDGNRHWKLTDNPQEEGWHAWSPDGNWLAIELFDKEQTQFQIGLMNWRTKELAILTDTGYAYQQAPNFFIKK